MSDAFEFIGSRLIQSLSGVPWTSAWISFELVDRGVVQRTQRYRPTSGSKELDFRLVDPIGILNVLESLRNKMVQQGHPRWVGLVIRIQPTGDYQFEYRYPDSGPSRLINSDGLAPDS